MFDPRLLRDWTEETEGRTGMAWMVGGGWSLKLCMHVYEGSLVCTPENYIHNICLGKGNFLHRGMCVHTYEAQ